MRKKKEGEKCDTPEVEKRERAHSKERKDKMEGRGKWQTLAMQPIFMCGAKCLGLSTNTGCRRCRRQEIVVLLSVCLRFFYSVLFCLRVGLE